MDDLLIVAKQFLSIVETSTLKDAEINSLIEAGKLELERVNIDVSGRYDSLIETTILMFVKANFGNVNLKEKEYARRSFESLIESLSLSSKYLKAESSKWEQ